MRYSRYLAAVEMGKTCPGGRRLEREIHTIFDCSHIPKETRLQCGYSEKVTVPYHKISKACASSILVLAFRRVCRLMC